MKRKISALMAVTVIGAISVTGLSACASEDTAEAALEATTEMITEAGGSMGEAQPNMGSRGIMAKVTAVDGSAVTVIEESRMERGGGAPDGEELEKPDGEMPADGEAPEKPDGEAPQGEMPQGEAPMNGEKPNGEAPADGEAPEKPDMQAPADGEAPEKPDGHQPADGEMPEMTFDGEEKIITVDTSILYTEGENGEKVQADLSDITVDTVLSITYDEDGVTPTEIVIRK